MGPLRKDVLDKAAWAWADTTEPSSVSSEHVATAYRIRLQECRPGTCRRNCRGSPRCLSGLGEQKWLNENGEESSVNDAEDPNEELREIGAFIGLKNLGATCYVNSLLQLWFHNLPFRRAMYEWDPMEDPEEQRSLVSEPPTFPATCVGHLQALFANLQFGNRRYIDPSDFIHSLGLDTTQQQDAQEFSKLFISMLEDRLTPQTKPSVRDMISKNFRGQYSYVTRCSKCGTESTRPSTFYELDLNIQGHRTLGDTLAEFLREERLEGANQYHCAICSEKQDATRSICLQSVPPVLHLQLLRFVYDRLKGHKKKLNSLIQFPEKLDMSEYLSKPPGTLTYSLSAVLLHMGSSAYSGHYVAHIRDSMTGTWHKFNDESVERMEGKKLKLGTEEDGSDSGAPKKGRNQRPAKGFLTSKNAYMLVYSADTEGSADQDAVPAPLAQANGSEVNSKGVCGDFLYAEMMRWGLATRLQDLVTAQNRKFEEWTDEEKNKRETSKIYSQVRRDEMRSLCNDLPVGNEAEKFDFVSMDWLIKCLHEGLGDDSSTGPIDNNKDKCPHGCVNPTRVTNMKIISTSAADVLYERFSGGPRLEAPSALCRECVVNKCKEIRLKAKIANDMKEIANLLKYRMDETERAYWVGKHTLKNWKSCVLRRLDSSVDRDEKNEYKDDNSILNGQESSEAKGLESIEDENKKIEDRELFTGNSSVRTVQQRDVNGPDTSKKLLPNIETGISESTENKRELRVLKNSQSRRTDNLNGTAEVSLPIAKRLKLSESESLAEVTNSLDLTSDNNSQSHSKAPLLPSQNSFINSSQSEEEVSSTTDHGLSIEKKDEDEMCSVHPKPDSTMPGPSSPSSTQVKAISGTSRPKEREQMRPEENGTVSKNDTEDSKMDLVDENHPSSHVMNDGKRDEDFESDGNGMGFNEDIICPHGNLNIDEASRRLVIPRIWNIFRSYFPAVKDFPRNAPICSSCQTKALEGQVVKDSHRKIAQQQKETLSDFFYARNRPNLEISAKKTKTMNGCSTLIEGKEQFYIVSYVFLEQWKAFISNKAEPPFGLVNEELVCEHQGLLYSPLVSEDCEKRLILIWPSEWSALQQFYSVDRELGGQRDVATGEVTFSPRVCDECQVQRMVEQQAALCHYERAKVYVRRVNDDKRPISPPPIVDPSDPEFTTAAVVLSASSNAGEIRRSNRTKKPRGGKELIVSSDMKLMALKIEIFKAFRVAPFAQHLTLDGRTLEDPNMTLGSLSVYPKCVLMLRADEPSEDAAIMDDYMKSATPEEGFKGTGLLSR